MQFHFSAGTDESEGAITCSFAVLTVYPGGSEAGSGAWVAVV